MLKGQTGKFGKKGSWNAINFADFGEIVMSSPKMKQIWRTCGSKITIFTKILAEVNVQCFSWLAPI